MGFFNFFKLKKKQSDLPKQVLPEVDGLANIVKEHGTGDCVEFLLAGDIEVFDDWNNVMTPNTFIWEMVERDNWTFYKVGADEFSYSVEPPGIQMIFNRDVDYKKAKAIASEVTENIRAMGQEVELVEIKPNIIYRF